MRFAKRDHDPDDECDRAGDFRGADRDRDDDRDRFDRDRWRDEWDDWSVNPYDRERRERGGRY